MMNQADVNKLHYGSAELPLKRKRGRPRKHPKPDGHSNGNISKSQNLNKNLNLGGHPQVTLGLGSANVNPPLQREPGDNAKNSMIGQRVSGIVEAVFDAGFLLSVTVGNGDTILRGVVFKPGRYVPVSAENDVAPNVKMIQRNETPLPVQEYANINKKETHSLNGFQTVNRLSGFGDSSSNLTAARGKQVFEVTEQTILPATGGKILPVNLSNGVSVANQTSLAMSGASHLLPSKGKEGHKSAHPASQVPMAGNQAPPSQIQSGSPMGMQNEDSLLKWSRDELQELEAKSMGPGTPFEKRLSEVLKRIPAPPHTTEMEVENGKADGNTFAIRPLQTMHPHIEAHSALASKDSEIDRKDKMDEPLQEDRKENQVHHAGEISVGVFSEIK